MDLGLQMTIISQMRNVASDLDNDLIDIKNIHNDLLIENEGALVEVLSEKLSQCEKDLSDYSVELDKMLSKLAYIANDIYGAEHNEINSNPINYVSME